jgi:O-antigen biosynthesis protein WbqP
VWAEQPVVQDFQVPKHAGIDKPSVPSADRASLKITRVGAFIRRTNIDELPQLLMYCAGRCPSSGQGLGLPKQEDLMSMRRARGVDRLRPGLDGACASEIRSMA